MKNFVPLKTFQGLSPLELKSLVGTKTIFLWGAGHLGKSLKRSFENNGLRIQAFCDSNPQTRGKQLAGLEVLDPESAMESAKAGKSFIVIASARHRGEIEARCASGGLVRSEHFLGHTSISRPEAVVEIVGPSARKSRAGPLGNAAAERPVGMMGPADYRRVLDKLLIEIPNLMNIELAAWGEPLFNPGLHDIIQETEKRVSSTVTTSLQLSDGLESLARGGPSQIIIIAGGHGRSYEENHSGASWTGFLSNLESLRKLAERHSPESQISIAYQCYGNNQGQDLQRMKDLCADLGLRFYTAWPYITPYEKLLDLAGGKPLEPEDREVARLLPWDLDRALSAARREIQKPCLCQRIFPIINWNLAVLQCHVYQGPVIAVNFLELSLDDLLKARHSQAQCLRCQSAGLHRLDIEVLLQKYPASQILRGEERAC